jgi:GH15 family glucan-1,4-alpha-glucosidase
MALLIEDYALIGDMCTAGLVGRDGSIDWLCLPRFDSGACFAGLLGDDENGHWKIAPRGAGMCTKRCYWDGSLILETTFKNDDGQVTIIDFMPLNEDRDRIDLARIVRGDSGCVQMDMELVLRFEYGAFIPWVRSRDYGMTAIAGPDAVQLRTPAKLEGKDYRTRSSFTVREGEQVPFLLTWHPSNLEPPPEENPFDLLKRTQSAWEQWSGQCSYRGAHQALVHRSLIVLKALTHTATGGIVAAATTSLPEHIGGVRNWDYRYCWLRDATFTLYSLIKSGYEKEAAEWQRWLLRAVAGKPSDLQIMYGIAGERLLPENEIPWLSGYECSKPVRTGNAAHNQFQLDVYGEIMDCFHVSSKSGVDSDSDVRGLQLEIMAFLESAWDQPDEGLWEMRGPRRQFTHSKVMAWVAVDRAIKGAEQFGLEGPLDKWKALRAQIKKEVCEQGWDDEKQSFVQYYGGKDLDASLLMIPLVGFLPPTDPRVVGTMEAVERELMNNGLVIRYTGEGRVDGLPDSDSPFLACSFWLADNLELTGRHNDARRLFDRLAGLANDVGLLSEEYDPVAKRMLGNFPQAFSHVGLVNTAHNLQRPSTGPAKSRAKE